MSKIFINENPQAPAPLRYQRRGDYTRTNWRSLAATPKRPREGFEHPAVFAVGLVMMALLVFALVAWGKQIAMVAAVFVLLGLFARSPILAIGGALTLLLLAR